MVDRFLGDGSGVLFCLFWSIVAVSGAGQSRAVSGVRFLTGGVFECDIAHRRSVAVLYVC